MKRIDARAGWSRLTFEQQSRYCHLADLFDVPEPADDPRAETEAQYAERMGWQAQRNADADAARTWGEPAQYT